MKYVPILLLKFYRIFVSPLIVALIGKGCRFTPTCSQYTIEALEKYGTIKGIWLGARRLIRCHPFGGFGIDPVPENL